MKQLETLSALEWRWERAVEQAQQESTRQELVEPETFNTVAGLRIQSGVNAGGWTSSCSCNGQCTGPCVG